MIAILNGLFQNSEVGIIFSFFVVYCLYPFIMRLLHA